MSYEKAFPTLCTHVVRLQYVGIGHSFNPSVTTAA